MYQKRNLNHSSSFKNILWLLHQLFSTMVNLSPNFVGRRLVEIKFRIDSLSTRSSDIHTFTDLSWHRISKGFHHFSSKLRWFTIVTFLLMIKHKRFLGLFMIFLHVFLISTIKISWSFSNILSPTQGLYIGYDTYFQRTLFKSGKWAFIPQPIAIWR